MTPIESRVVSLERKLAGWSQRGTRWPSVAMCAVCVAALCSYPVSSSDAAGSVQRGPDNATIRVRSLEIVDASGRVAISLRSDEANGRLEVLNSNGTPIAAIGPNAGGHGTFNLYRKDGTLASTMGGRAEGAHVQLYYSDGKQAGMAMSTSDDRSAFGGVTSAGGLGFSFVTPTGGADAEGKLATAQGAAKRVLTK